MPRVTLGLAADAGTTPWYPFIKNMSSRESIMFLSDSVVLNPFELVLIVTTISWVLGWIGNPDTRLRVAPLTWPLVLFGVIVVLAFVYSIGRGGDFRVAVFESRPLLYLPMLYVLITNLVTSARTYYRLFYAALAAISVQAVLALVFYRTLDEVTRLELQDLGEHSAAVHQNAVIICFVAIFILGARWFPRTALLGLAMIPVATAFVLAQRRSAAVALGIGIALLGVLLFWKRPKRAMWIVPLALVVGVGYVLAFWNAGGGIGFGAQAVKSYISPGSISESDSNSNLYREIEALNIWFTIRSNELFGVGFGRPFLRPYPLADISNFTFADYIPHNGILWVWMKTGVVGFATMLYIITRSLQDGTRRILGAVDPNRAVVLFTALAYIIMYTVFAFVDIAWDVRSCIFLALCFAICTAIPADTDRPIAPIPTMTGRRALESKRRASGPPAVDRPRSEAAVSPEDA